MCGKSRGFTLLELLIAVVLSLFIFVSILELYNSVQRVSLSVSNTWNDTKLLQLLNTIQRQLLACEEVQIQDNKLSYITTLGLAKPVVRVEVLFQKDSIKYREIKPYDASLLYETIIPSQDKPLLLQHDRYIELKFDKKVHTLVIYPLRPPPSLLLPAR